MTRGLLIVFSGPSGVGKNTVRENFVDLKDLKLKYSISATTRPQRPGEVNGKDYFFISKDEFNAKIRNYEFLEYANFVGNYYGTLEKHVNMLRDEGHNVLLEIEVDGALQVMAKDFDCLTVFLIPPSYEELERRIRNRATESEDKILSRLEKARKELPLARRYRYVVVNDDPKRAGAEVANIIRQEIKNAKEKELLLKGLK